MSKIMNNSKLNLYCRCGYEKCTFFFAYKDNPDGTITIQRLAHGCEENYNGSQACKGCLENILNTASLEHLTLEVFCQRLTQLF